MTGPASIRTDDVAALLRGAPFGWLLTCFAIVIFLASVAGIELTRTAGNVALVWLPNAVTLGFILLLGARGRWPVLGAAFAATLVANLLYGDAPGVALMLALANVTTVCVAVSGLQRAAWDRNRTASPRDIVLFTGIAILLAPASGALVGASTLALAYDAPFPDVARTWLISDVVGMVALAPALLLPASVQLMRARWLEAVGWTLLLAAGAFFAGSRDVVMFLFTFPPALILVGMRLGPIGVGVGGIPAAMVICWQVAAGESLLFAHFHATLPEMILGAQVFFFSSFGVGHLIALLWQDRQERENRLRHYQVAFENSSEGLLLIDADGNYVLWNGALETIAGYDEAQLARIGPYGRPEHREANRRLMDRLRAGETIRDHRMTRTRPDGSVSEIVLSALPIFEDGRFVGASMVHRDVTEVERLRREAEHRATELEYYRIVVENASDAFMLVDSEGRFILRNPAFHRMLGITEDMVVANGGRGRPEYQAENAALVARAMAGEIIRDHRIRRRHVDGRVLDIILNATPVQSKGAFIGASVVLRDVTEVERLRQEAEDRATELERYKVAFEYSAEGMMLTGPDGGFEVWNSAYERALGVSGETLRRNRLFGRERHRDENRGLYLRNLAGEQVIDHPLKRQLPDGTVADLMLTATPIFRDGVFLGSSITLRDVTEIERLRIEAERQATILQAFLDVFGDVVIGTDPDGRVNLWNRAATTMYGIDREQAIGQLIHDIPGAQSREISDSRRSLLRAGERVQIRGVERRLPDGRRLIVDVSIKPIFDNAGNYIGAAGVQRDVTEITDRRKTETLLASALESITDAVAIFDADERLVRWNARYAEVYGAASDKVVAGAGWDDLLRAALEVGNPPVPREEWDDWLAARRKRRLEKAGPFALQAADERWMLAADYPIESGGWVAVRQDITELKRVEAELQRSNAELEQFAFIASHDLQEPLRKIQSFGQIIVEDFAADLPEEARTFFAAMIAAADRQQALIDDLLTYSRVANSREAPVSLDLDGVVAEALDNILLLLRENDADIRVESLPRVTARRSDMIRVFQNVVTNAVKYRSPGRTPVVEVRVGAELPDRVEIEVRDNGRGFDDGMADRMFEPFRRLVARDNVSGTGMGLAIVRKAMQQQGGDATATGVPGEGSVIRLVFRRAPQEYQI
ncbi:MAG: PAS domain S-box protein [Pseudomonadota bacterium]|nr:PAS domain S-box protein [Pseudomonadota bacterium]